MSTNEQSSTQISANAKKKGVEKESGIGGGGASWSTLEAEGEIEVNRDEEDSGMSTSDDDSPLANKLVLDDKLKKRFAILYLQRTHGTVSFRTDFIRRYKDHECERCASLSLECVTLDWERHIPCDECGKTRLPCSKMHLFKRELLMKRMGINEKTFDALYKEYQENLKGKEGAVGSRGKPDRIEEMERDELVSSDVERGKAEQTSGNKKRKTEDEEASKKKRPKTSLSRQRLVPEVVILTQRDTNQKGNQRGENETEPNAPRNTVVDTASVSENRRNDREENGGEDDNGLENVVETPIRQKRQRYPTKKAQYASRERQKNGSSTRSIHSTRSPTSVSVAKSTGSKLNLSVHSSPAERAFGFKLVPGALLMQTNSLAATPGPFMSTLTLNQNRRSIPNPASTPTRAGLRPQAIPEELSLAAIKRQMENISSDLRYDRVSVEETLKRFDEVGVRLRKHADILEKESR